MGTVSDIAHNGHEVSLQGGMLRLGLRDGKLDALHRLARFAGRQNPKRGFLFVSRVLGKHLPVRPQEMLRSHQALAHKLEPFLAVGKKALFLGFAETAIGLGAGVFDACLAGAAKPGYLFMQTTRYAFDAPVVLHFQEEHSHSTDHLLYEPTVSSGILREADSVVLIDDELSTGKTSVNFLRALMQVNPHIRRVALVSLLNWMSTERRGEVRAQLPSLGVEFVSLLDGSFEFEPHPGYVCPPMPSADSLATPKDSLVRSSFGRFGYDGHLAIECAAVIQGLDLNKSRPVHVIGDGEFLHPPFLLAKELESRGYDTWFQSTTRSPILMGHAIESKTQFADHYQDGIENYIYNLPPESTDAQLILCHESNASLSLTRQRIMQTVHFEDIRCK